jgi:hypothetical protein
MVLVPTPSLLRPFGALESLFQLNRELARSAVLRGLRPRLRLCCPSGAGKRSHKVLNKATELR